jgi:hypothetical protein
MIYLLLRVLIRLLGIPIRYLFPQREKGQEITEDTVENVTREDMDTKTRVFCSGPYMFSWNSHKVGKVDTKTLVVGQEVYMFSGCYTQTGWVVKVTPSGVDVQTGVMQNDGTWNSHEVVHFDNNGRSYVTELPSSYDSKAHPLSPWGWDGNGTYECGPWELDDIPFAERTALLAQAAREWEERTKS